MTESIEKRVQKALEEIRPRIHADGGDVELVAVEKLIVKVRLSGACAGCPMAVITLKQGVESLIKERVPEILKVEAVK
jgi:Fe-S cluster biogenesis protein NfuA